MKREEELKILRSRSVGSKIKVGPNGEIELKIKPFTSETIVGILGDLGEETEKPAKAYQVMVKRLSEKIGECIDRDDEFVRMLTPGERLKIANEALELDPELPKNLLRLPRQFGMEVEPEKEK